jgi:trk system potassium uptake protein TrkH
MHVMRAEVPGPTVGKLVSKLRASARILYGIYCILTVIEMIMLFAGGMPLFDSITIAFGTAGTGGFGILNSSIAGYNTYCQIVITIFMTLFGINFNFYFLLLFKRFKDALKSSEVWTYLGIIAVSIGIITLNIAPLANSFGTALRQAGFQVVSVITTTGFVTADFNSWPMISQTILITLMFIGACSGSTGGGLKVGRIIILFKACVKELRRALNPRRVKCIRLDSAVLEKETVSATCVYLVVYILVIAVSILLVSINNHDFTTTVSSVITCINNVGPGLSLIGPVENFTVMSSLSKIVLTLDMLIGRLEVLPMMILFIPSTWKKNS